MNGNTPNHDPSVTAMTMDLLGNVLSRADSPGKLGEYLTEEIRELTGARCVIFIRCLGTKNDHEHRVISVNPLRRYEWAASDAMQQLYKEVHHLPTSQVWRAEDASHTSKRLQQEGFELSLTVPLTVGNDRVGALLALGLPDANHLNSVIKLLNTLSTITALVLRNAFYSENQDQIIESRTHELRLANEALRASDTQIRALLEQSKRAQHALLSLLEDQKAVVAEQRAAEREVRRLNTELEQRVIDRTAKLEASNKELEAFSYSISHDLRSPLRAINGFAHILRSDYSAIMDNEGQRHLGVICSESKRMGQLVDDLLAFSRMNREPLHTTEVNMAALTQAVFNECIAQTPGRQVQLKLLPLPMARADPPMLRQALVNLISNAIKYTRPNPAAEIEIGVRQETSELVYYIKDNGVGFDPKYTDKLFGVFQRLHSENEFEGTGVGLALVQRIIHRHGGRIWAEAKVNEGATFLFTIPTKNPPN